MYKPGDWVIVATGYRPYDSPIHFGNVGRVVDMDVLGIPGALEIVFPRPDGSVFRTIMGHDQVKPATYQVVVRLIQGQGAKYRTIGAVKWFAETIWFPPEWLKEQHAKL